MSPRRWALHLGAAIWGACQFVRGATTYEWFAVVLGACLVALICYLTTWELTR